jgi:hypothetical protein
MIGIHRWVEPISPSESGGSVAQPGHFRAVRESPMAELHYFRSIVPEALGVAS